MSAPTGVVEDRSPRRKLSIALINNMPDTALEATEAQFASLVTDASPELPVELRLFYIPEIPRGAAAMTRLRSHYSEVDELPRAACDALIVTGLEPGAGPLVQEPYWARLAQLIDWVESHTRSSLWSCLAAHAVVQHFHGIQRRRLPQKCFGVFAHTVDDSHPLMRGIASPFYVPHSRWNELPPGELTDAGYRILSTSPHTGADLFVREGRSLAVCLQGHPEYQDATLLKEYRRDVGRYFRGQQAHYPNRPSGYFSPEATSLLERFEAQARAERDPQLLERFPYAELEAGVRNMWRGNAVQLYRNWLRMIARA